MIFSQHPYSPHFSFYSNIFHPNVFQIICLILPLVLSPEIHPLGGSSKAEGGFTPQGTLAMFDDIFGCDNFLMLLVSRGYRAEMLLKIL